jgi:hypothetical protein
MAADTGLRLYRYTNSLCQNEVNAFVAMYVSKTYPSNLESLDHEGFQTNISFIHFFIFTVFPLHYLYFSIYFPFLLFILLSTIYSFLLLSFCLSFHLSIASELPHICATYYYSSSSSNSRPRHYKIFPFSEVLKLIFPSTSGSSNISLSFDII